MPCALCRQEKSLMNSHIIPEFMFKALYDDQHRFKMLTIDPNDKNRLAQKGVRERLLCKNCEQRLSVHERYASLLFYGGVPIGCTRDGDKLFLTGINYPAFKLFQLSILWRASVSKLGFFSKVDLGPDEEHLRELLVNDDPGPAHAYPCVLFGLHLDPGKPTSMMVQPERQRIDDRTHYLFIFGSFLWDFAVSTQPLDWPLSEVVLAESGTMMVPLRPVAALNGLKPFFSELSRLGRG